MGAWKRTLDLLVAQGYYGPLTEPETQGPLDPEHAAYLGAVADELAGAPPELLEGLLRGDEEEYPF